MRVSRQKLWRALRIVVPILLLLNLAVPNGRAFADPAAEKPEGAKPTGAEPTGPDGQFVPLRARALGSELTIPAGGEIPVLVAGQAGIPDRSVAAVAAQITVSGRGSGELLAHPNGDVRQGEETARTLAYEPGARTRAFALLRLGTDGRVLLVNRGSESVKVGIDVEGYMLDSPGTVPAGGFAARPYDPIGRIDALPGESARTLTPPKDLGLPAKTQAVMLQIAVRAPGGSAPGTVSLTPVGRNGTERPQVTYAAGRTTTNTLVTTPSSAGYIVRNHGSAAVEVSVALAGYFSDTGDRADRGQRLVPTAPLPLTSGDVTLKPGHTTTLDLSTQKRLPMQESVLTALVLGLTTRSSGAGTLRVRPESAGSGAARPAALPYNAGARTTGSVIVGLPGTGTRRVVIENGGDSAVTINADLQGYARTLGTPGVPAAVTATPGDTEATVTWTAPADDGGSAITGYTVTSAPGGMTAHVSADKTSATVTGLTNARGYTFTVTAENPLGRSAASPPSAGVTPVGPPGAPTAVSASAGNTTATLTWKAPADNGGRPITSYTVTAKPGGKTATVVGGKTTATVTGLKNGQPYTLTVTAANSTGTGTESAASRVVTPAAPAEAPTAIRATAGDGRATVSWTPPSRTGGSPVTGYTVTSAPGGKTVQVTRGQKQALITGLKNGTAYTFTVAARSAAGPGKRSAASEPVTPTGKPAAPTQVTAAPGDRSATVSWTPPRDSGGAPVSEYTVTATPGGATMRTRRTSLAFSGLRNGTTYTFTVRARNARGTGASSEASTPVTLSRTFTALTSPSAPGAPTQVTAVPGDRQARVSWTAPADDGGSPITGYTVTSSPGGLTATAAAGDTSATVTGLTNGTAYTFTVKATNSVGDSPGSTPSTSVTPPGAIVLDAQIGGPKVTLTTTVALQDGRIRFSGVAGQRVSVHFSGSSFAYGKAAVSLVGPSGSGLVAPYKYWSGSYVIEPLVLPSAGEYSVVVDPLDDVTGSVGVQVFEVADQVLAASVGGSAVQVSTSVPGQRSLVRFSGSAGQRVSAGFSGSSFVYGKAAVSLVGPSGSELVAPYKYWSGSYVIEPLVLPSAGEYSVVVDPLDDVTGSVRVQVFEVADQVLSATVNGPAVQVATSIPGQNSRIQFAGTVGQQVSLKLSNSTYGYGNATPSLLKPDGTVMQTGSPYWSNGAYTYGPLTLPADGTYTFLIDPKMDAAGGVAAQVTGESGDVATSVTVGGATTTVITAAGKNGTVTFSGQKDTPVVVNLTGNSYGAGNLKVSIVGADQSELVAAQTLTSTARTFGPITLPATGPYTIVLDPQADAVGQVTVGVDIPPGPPTQVSATAKPGGATVTWTAPAANGGSARTGYVVTSSPGGLTATASAGATSATVTGLTNGTAYTFTVAARNAGGDGAQSSPTAPVTPVDVPGKPAAPTTQLGSTQVTVSWTEPGDTGGLPITSYTVKSSPGGQTTTVSGDQRSVVVTGLTNGTAYTFTVTATNARGTGPVSDQSAPVTPAAVPDRPTGAAAVLGDRQATVTWTAPASDGGAPISSYTVVSSPGGRTTTVPADARTAAVQGLTNGTAYTFTVYATNVAGNGAASEPTTPVIPVGPPGSPTEVAATAANGTATVTWRAPDDDGGAPLTGFVVTSDPGGFSATVPATATSADVTDLVPGAGYVFTVRAVNAAGIESAPSEASTEVFVDPPPGAPGRVEATPRDGSATVSWLAPDGRNETEISSYTVTTTPNTQTTTVASDVTSATIGGLTNGTAYTFTVTVHYRDGGSVTSAPSRAVTPAAVPGAPTQVTALPGDRQARVTWAAPADLGGLALTGYRIRVMSDLGDTVMTVGPVATTATVTGLVNGTAYTFDVAAVNDMGIGPRSAPTTPVTPASGQVPGRPTQVVATAGAAQAAITWSAPADGGSPITSYTVTATPGGRTVTTTTTTATVADLRPGTAYTFTVAATNAVGTGPASEPSASVVPTGTVTAPSHVTAVAGDRRATVNWAEPAPGSATTVTSYTVTSTPGGKTATAAPGSPTATVTGLTNGNSYTFIVTASYSDGTSVTSEPSEPVVPVGLPGSPGSVTAWPGDGAAGLSWGPPTDGGDLTGYVITVAPGGRTVTTDARTSWTQIDGLTNGTAYTFTVAATNAFGTGTLRTSSAVTPARAPGPPTNVVATSGDGSAAVSWTKPAGVDNVTSYLVVASPGGGAQDIPGGTTSATFTGLTNGTPYTFKVSVGAGGAVSTSNPVIPKAGTGPAQPPPARNPNALIEPVTTPGPTILDSIARIDADTTWGPTGSPYVVENLSVSSGATLTLLPGTVVKFKRYNSAISVSGKVLSLGTPGRRVIFTSIKDDAVLGDTNGDGSASTPQEGDWMNVMFANASKEGLSVLDNTDVRYGAWGGGASICGGVNGGAVSAWNSNLVISSSTFMHNEYDGVELSNQGSDPRSYYGIYGNRFGSSHCGLTVSGSGGVVEAIGNTFDDSIEFSGFGFLSDHDIKVRFWFNTVYSKIDVAGIENTPVRSGVDVRYNALVGGVRRMSGYGGRDLAEYSQNWWNYDLNSSHLPECMDKAAADANNPPIQYSTDPKCAAGQVKPLSYTFNAGPALSVPPASIPISLNRSQSPRIGPVDTFSGTLEYTATDMSVEDAGKAIAATRTYHSGDATTSGDLGNGWVSAFSEKLSNVNGMLSMSLPDGSTLPFMTDPAAGNVPVPGVNADLETEANGTTVRLADKTGYHFDTAGALTQMTLGDKNHKIQVERENGHPVKVVGVSGRYLAYDRASGVVQRITDSQNRTTQYGYTGERLTSVTGVDGKTETYSYDADGRLTRVTTPDGKVKLNVGYNAEGKVAWIEQQGQGRTSFTYDAAERTTTVTRPDGAETVQQYDWAGRLVHEQTERSGRHIVYDGEGRPIVTVEGVPNQRLRNYSASATGRLYDAKGNPVLEMSPGGTMASTTFNSERQPLVSTFSDGTTVKRTYDENERLATYTDQRGKVTRYTYDSIGRVTTVTDPLGRKQTQEFGTGVGDLVATVDNTGARTVFGHDPLGRVTSVSDPLGEKRMFEYTPWGQLKKVTQPRGGTYTVAFNDDRQPVSLTDPLGRVAEYLYDSDGVLSGVKNPAGQTSTFGYDPLGRPTRYTDPRGETIRQEYSPEGWATKLVAQDGGIITYGHDPAGRVTRTTDSLGNVSRVVYDIDGRMVRNDTPDGFSERYEYNAMGLLVGYWSPQSTDWTGPKWTYDYDPAGNRTVVTGPDGKKITLAYDATGRVTRRTDPLGRDTIINYSDRTRTQTIRDGVGLVEMVVRDPLGRMVRRLDGRETTDIGYDDDGNVSTVESSGRRTEREYDLAGQMLKQTDPMGQVTTATYDPLGRMSTRTFRGNTTDTTDDSTESFTYDLSGNLSTRTDRVGQKWTYQYDGANRVISATDPLQHTTLYAYDTAGNRTATTDPTGVVQRTGYDAMGRPAVTSDITGASWTVQYDAMGNPVKTVDPAGVTATATYDDYGRVLRAFDGSATTEYTYDAAGQPTQINRLTGSTQISGQTIAYDSRGRRTRVTDQRGRSTKYAYDITDNVTKVTSPSGREYTYTYASSGELTSATDPLGNRSSYRYNAAGQPTRLTLPGGGTRTFAYDGLGRLASETDPTERVTTYSYDAEGRPLTTSRPSGRTTTATYDDAGRLTGLTSGTDQRTFAYDDAGRLTHAVTGQRAVDLTYDNRGLPLTSNDGTGQVTYTYDVARRLAGRAPPEGEPTTYRYGADGRLAEIRGPTNLNQIYSFGADRQTVETRDPNARVSPVTREFDGSGLPTSIQGKVKVTGAQTEPYDLRASYNDDGQITKLVQHVPGNDGSGTTTYRYDGAGRLITANPDNGDTQNYEWDARGNRTSIRYGSGPKVTTTYDASGQATGSSDGAVRTYDADGNLTGVTRTDAPTVTYGYNGFGELTSAQAGAEAITYRRDALGRTATRTGAPGTETFGYDGTSTAVTGYRSPTGVASSLIRDPGRPGGPRGPGAARHRPPARQRPRGHGLRHVRLHGLPLHRHAPLPGPAPGRDHPAVLRRHLEDEHAARRLRRRVPGPARGGRRRRRRGGRADGLSRRQVRRGISAVGVKRAWKKRSVDGSWVKARPAVISVRCSWTRIMLSATRSRWLCV
ncbi:hypothetical protein GQ466_17330 [Actinomadura rayongensis]|uniref:Fibronectin type-III domain-containing protein n=1 Tax=Actinomadura rayongensis TaxID=1429076 RepID=A0A6I4W830_9ACTN|nr:hypothetical protein [Actinomadura rayongensis]